MFKTILVGFDGSDASHRALALAADVAAKYRAKVVVLHALLHGEEASGISQIAQKAGFLPEIKEQLDDLGDIQPTSMATDVAIPPAIIVPKFLLQQVGQRLLDFAENALHRADVSNVSVKLADADPASSLLAEAETEATDLIVVGSRGMGNIKSLVLGSVSQKVIHNSNCPCLVVR